MTDYPYPPGHPCHGYTKEQCERICEGATTPEECREAVKAFEEAVGKESDDGSSFWGHCRLENGHLICNWPVLDLPPRPQPDPSPIAHRGLHPAVLLHNGWVYARVAKLQETPKPACQVPVPECGCKTDVLKRNE